jgi:predicted phosphate transport protein (TIGR00153 family)
MPPALEVEPDEWEHEPMTVTSYASRIFGRSPFKPLQVHVGICYECAELVVPVLQASSAGDWSEVASLRARLVELEHDADEIKREIRTHLPKGFFLPVARRDLLDLLTQQDRMANKAKGIAGLILGRKLEFPEQVHASLIEFARQCIAVCEQAAELIGELDELLDTGFTGVEVMRVRAMIYELDLAERGCDAREIEVRAELFVLEHSLVAIDVLFMYRSIEWIGDLSNIGQRIGHRLEMLLAG